MCRLIVLVLVTVLLAQLACVSSFINGMSYSIRRKAYLTNSMSDNDDTTTETEAAGPGAGAVEINEADITSKDITRLLKRKVELLAMITETQENRKAEDQIYEKLDEEYGSEIARIKKEFARIKERSYEEAVEVSNKAKTDALKEVLPVTDNFLRAKSLFQPINSDSNEGVIQGTYDDIFASFTKVIEDFGVTRVVSVGEPFDFNFMEAIMTQPSTEYKADIVSIEYQIGYKIGNRCIRPAMVVVSTGPGPQN